LLKQLREDNVSGANEFIDNALEIIKLQLAQTDDFQKDIKEEFIRLLRQIVNARLSMAPLINVVGYFIHDLQRINKKIIEDRLLHFIDEREKRKNSIDLNFHTFLKQKESKPLKIMLISYSSTIINLLLKNKESLFEFYVLESRPLLEGHRVAEILSPHFKTHLIIDAAIGTFIDEIDVILVGVDSVLMDGSIVNKIGTFPLAVLAKSKNIDVYAVCDSYKYNLRSHFGQSVPITEKPINEVYNKEISYEFLEVHNYYFDITPSEYISGFISDLGILSCKDFLEKVKKSLPIEWFKYFIDKK
jgi:translation initiation factor 2B subunit (eIF-2B alpha/beta/delta family)